MGVKFWKTLEEMVFLKNQKNHKGVQQKPAGSWQRNKLQS